MDEILQKANELGLMIQQTDTYREYREQARMLEDDSDAKALLELYESRLAEISMRERNGDIIEEYEREELRDMARNIATHAVIGEYLAAKKNYIDLLERIQQALVHDS